MSKQKVFWTPSEQTKIAHAVATWQLRTGTKMLNIKLVDELQNDILERHRRRALKALSQVPWLEDMVESQRQQILAVNGHPLKHLQSNKNGNGEKATPTPPPIALEVLLKQLVSEVSGIHRQLAILNKQPSTSPLQPEQSKETLKKVLLVGPLQKQLNILQEEYKGLLDLSTAEDISRVSEMAKNKDVVLLWTNKMNHKMGDAAKSVAEDQCWYVTGGMTSLRAALEEIAIGIED